MNPEQKNNEGLENVEVAHSLEVKPGVILPKEANEPWSIPAICIFLALITLAVFGQTFRYSFVNFDDDLYVYQNPTVTGGLTLKGIVSAFTQGESENWTPLTTLSHMLDCQIYGLKAGGHHLTNVLLHITSVILLFLVLRQMTGFLWRSAFVAAVFAVHPLHVESVAWVSERKDTLSGVFFMLTLGAYVHYVRRPTSVPRYLLVLLLFAFGLMSKPMLVTLPFVLLLLDYWPLNRFSTVEPVPWLKNLSVPVRLVLEKVPLLILSIATCIPTLLVERQNIGTTQSFPLFLRTENAPISYVTHIERMFYPAKLAILYPYPNEGLPIWKVSGAVIVLVVISLGVLQWRRKRPYLLVGWLWYLGMLVPVIGLVQVGSQARADRHTYLPLIGLSIMVVWLAAELSVAWRNRRLVLGCLASIVILAMVFSARVQASYWRDSVTLWSHTLAVTSNNVFAHDNFGDALNQSGRVDDAIIEYEKALAMDPNFAQAYNDLGNALAQKGLVDAAILGYQKALAIDPNDAEAHNNLGDVLAQKGQVDAAIIEFQKALAINPDFADAYCDLGNALSQKGQLDEAILDYQKALAINPRDAQTCYDLGTALAQRGRLDEAIVQFQKALAIDPNNAQACYNLAYALLQKGRMDEAIVQFQKVIVLTPDDARAYNSLGIAYFQKGQVDEAIFQFQKALALQPGYGEAQAALTRVAWILATSPNPSLRNGAKAVELAQHTDQLDGGTNPMRAATLAAAYAETGNFPEAITNARRALQLAASQNNPAMVAAFQVQLKCYQAGTPFRASATAR